MKNIRIGYEIGDITIMENVTEDEMEALFNCPFVNVILCWWLYL